MKLIKHFDLFLKERVNLRDSRIDRLDKRVAAVETFLSLGDDVIAENFLDLIPQGSYAHGTIINPVATNDEFDADVLLDMQEVDGWEAEDYVQELYTVLRSSSTYREMVSRRTRCVVIDYADDFHIDVVPFLTRHDQRYITNRATNEFELTNPEGFNAWLDEQNRLTGGRLVKAIRLMKYLRDYKNNFSIASVILTILIGGRVSSGALWADPDHYQDVPTTLKSLINDLDAYLQSYPLMPSIDDPSLPSENFNHRWDQPKYANFRNWIHTYSEWVNDAFDEEDRDESLKKWRRLLGDDFGTYVASTVVKASEAHLSHAEVRNTEETLTGKWGIPVRLDHKYRVKLQGRTRKRSGFRHYNLATQGNVVRRHVTIDFSIVKNTVPAPFEVYWKVRNTGDEAIAADMIRGQVVKGSTTSSEPTAYKGRHYVEVYIVKDGVCVAMDHHPVIVK